MDIEGIRSESVDCIHLAVDVNEGSYVLAPLGLSSAELVTWNNRAQWHTLGLTLRLPD